MSTPVNPKPFDPATYGPWALVVGGSEGVGAEIAFRLADQGVSTVLVARKTGPLEETAEAVRAKGVECRTLSVDLTEPGATEGIAAACEGLDLGLIVLNAGANTYGSEFVESDMAQVQKVIDLNITSPMQIIRQFGPVPQGPRPRRDRRDGLDGRLPRPRRHERLLRGEGVQPCLRRGPVAGDARVRRRRRRGHPRRRPHPRDGARRPGHGPARLHRQRARGGRRGGPGVHRQRADPRLWRREQPQGRRVLVRRRPWPDRGRLPQADEGPPRELTTGSRARSGVTGAGTSRTGGPRGALLCREGRAGRGLGCSYGCQAALARSAVVGALVAGSRACRSLIRAW
uniref:Short chain dehydrogenase n=1 Tax=Dietzia sp. E1 TaxID=328361 RepID=C0LMW9_9ACTN|nr:short chain dehydrogenase [Dietzia sp. E1]